MRIGLLEDDLAIQEMLHLILLDEGFVVTIYSSAEECLSSLIPQSHGSAYIPIDLLIIDWRLTGSISGTEVIIQLRNHSALAHLPVILTTAATFSDTEQLQNLHVSLLEKPFAVEEVVDLIKDLVQISSLGEQ